MHRAPVIAAVVMLTIVCGSPSADACSVPVFRYALEHWRADPYLVHVFHQGELTAEQLERIEALTPTGDDGSAVANLVVVTVDVDGDLGEGVAALWERQEPTAFPWMVVQAPGKFGAPAIDVWAGEFESDVVDGLVESPLRTKISKLLLEGESAVWVLLECGDEEQDNAAYELLKTELSRLQGVLELPPIDPADLDDLNVAPEELKLSFAALRLPPDDPREALFREMLLSVEHDLRDPSLTSRPMAFPVFGRGRALYALAGDGLVPETIETACRDLVGACTCTIKAQNEDGFDLVMATEWDRYIQPSLAVDESMPTLTGLAEFSLDTKETSSPNSPANTSGPPADSEDVTSSDVDTSDSATGAMGTDADHGGHDRARPSEADVAPENPLTRNTFLIVALLLAGIVVGSFLLIGRR